MSSNEISLTIEGKPGEEVEVRYKGDPQLEDGDPSPIIWSGTLGDEGRKTFPAPRAYLVIRGPRGVFPLTLYKEPADVTSKTVRLDDLKSD